MKRFSVEHMVGVLKQVQIGVPVAEMIRNTEQTYYRWRKEYGGLQVDQLRGTKRYLLTQREDEDALTRAIVELASQYGRYGYRRIMALLKRDG